MSDSVEKDKDFDFIKKTAGNYWAIDSSVGMHLRKCVIDGIAYGRANPSDTPPQAKEVNREMLKRFVGFVNKKHGNQEGTLQELTYESQVIDEFLDKESLDATRKALVDAGVFEKSESERQQDEKSK